MKSKIITLLIAVVASIGIIDAETYSGTCGDNLSWSLDTDEGILVITGNGEMTDWHGSNDVPWQPYLRYIKNVSLPEGLTSIGGMAFLGCSQLTEISIPANVSEIANGAFDDCHSLTAINVVEENQNYSSADGVLYNKAQTILYIYPSGKQDNSFDVPENIVVFDNHAFANNYINSVSLPASITNLGEYIFEECSNLTSISVDEGNSNYSSADGVLFNKDKTIIFKCPEGKFGTYTIPDNVTEIASRAFYLSNLTSISMSNSVTLIGEQSFAFCYNLNDMTLSNNLVEIKPSAFYECSALTAITLPNSVAIIGDRAFEHNGFTSVTIPANVTTLGDNVFHACNSLTTIEVSSTNPNYSSLNGVLYNKDQTILFEYPKGKTNTSFEIPESVTSIGKYAFYYASFSSIVIPSNVATIEESAFAICRDLKTITCYATNPPLLNGTIFSQVSKTACFLKVPAESISLYQNADQWKEFSTIQAIQSSSGDTPVFPDDPGTLTLNLELSAYVIDGDSISGQAPTGGGGYPTGTEVTITAQDIPGYEFVQWSDSVTDQTRTIVLNESMSLIAYYTHSMIEMPIAANRWNFICLPPLGNRQYTEDMFTYDGLTDVQWGTYNGTKRAAGQSGWETPEIFNALQGYIIFSTTAGTLRINAYEDEIRQGESTDTINAGMSAYSSSHPENESWNFLGNPFSQGYSIADFATAGITSPITVWNGTGYTTYTPGIDDYTLQPFEAFFIQKADAAPDAIRFIR